jgi:hypothetical protein
MGEREGAYWILVEKLEGKRKLRRSNLIYDDNIKKGLSKCFKEPIDLSNLAQNTDKRRNKFSFKTPIKACGIYIYKCTLISLLHVSASHHPRAVLHQDLKLINYNKW